MFLDASHPIRKLVIATHLAHCLEFARERAELLEHLGWEPEDVGNGDVYVASLAQLRELAKKK